MARALRYPGGSTYPIDSYADQVITLLDHLGVKKAVVGGISLGANVSLFAAAHYPKRVQALVLEMPVLERAVPAAAMMFVPMVLALHYGLQPGRLTKEIVAFFSDVARHVDPPPIGPFRLTLGARSGPPGVGRIGGRRWPRRSALGVALPVLLGGTTQCGGNRTGHSEALTPPF